MPSWKPLSSLRLQGLPLRPTTVHGKIAGASLGATALAPTSPAAKLRSPGVWNATGRRTVQNKTDVPAEAFPSPTELGRSGRLSHRPLPEIFLRFQGSATIGICQRRQIGAPSLIPVNSESHSECESDSALRSRIGEELIACSLPSCIFLQRKTKGLTSGKGNMESPSQS
eukprot:COSAG02_NODE_987_length_15443_cov_8.132625_8_plen_170_part_00